jgi:hypothetical protein
MHARQLFAGVVLGVAILALMVGSAGADQTVGGSDPLTFNFDENGNGSINVNGGGFQNLPGSLLADPSNGGIPALTYLLPGAVTPVGNGDVRIFENAGLTILGDVLRFTDSQGRLTGITADRMIFYSLLGGGALADTGFPANLGTGAVGGPIVENADGTFQFVAGGPNIYNGISNEGVPEPTSIALWSFVAMGLGAAYRRRKLAA